EEGREGGLIAVQSMLDPSIASSDQLRGQVIGEPGKLPKPAMQLSIEAHEFKRFEGEQEKLVVNDLVIVNAGTATAVGSITRLKGGVAEIRLKNPLVVWQKDVVAVSKRSKSVWRLAAYGFVR
ncbi:translation initiation factor IF-2 subunit gamma, partial [archaeon]|nr:translation initiation factor IF-2 subunit gamma [archaeon]